tara:strand:+ start:170 stop:508 length:339 start_codon:yes stop_codon:yes gene_type:complete
MSLAKIDKLLEEFKSRSKNYHINLKDKYFKIKKKASRNEYLKDLEKSYFNDIKNLVNTKNKQVTSLLKLIEYIKKNNENTDKINLKQQNNAEIVKILKKINQLEEIIDYLNI